MLPQVADAEIFSNFFLFGAKCLRTGKVRFVEAADDEKIDRKKLLKIVRGAKPLVTFNGINFDIPIISAAIAGLSIAKIKQVADAIIVGNMKPWDVEKAFGFTIVSDINHIDLMEVAPGQASLKLYNARLSGKRLQDLPYDPAKRLTPREMDRTYEYWLKDLDATENLFNALQPQLDLRTKMSREYGIDLRSKSDAQIAEAVIKKEVGEILGEKPKRPNIMPGTAYRYVVPDFISFHGDQLNDILDEIEDSNFTLSAAGKIMMPKALTDAVIRIGKGRYRMGIGGLHSSEESIGHVSDDEYALIDRDVASYYPAIIINLGLYPKHLGKAFLRVYKGIVARRLAAKKAGDKVVADSLKITINGSFGKFGSKWSALCSPNLLIQTTITGQLSLLMLIQRVERKGIEVVSANTDGLVIKCPRSRLGELNEIVAKWERDTGFDTEETRYKALYSQNVNNYIAVKEDGSVKLKGYFAPSALMKNPANDICTDAVIAHITEGKALRDTIRACRDITKFVTVRTVNGGALWGDGADVGAGDYLGKVVRFYYSTESDGAIHYKKPNAHGTHNKVPKSERTRPLMELPEHFPDDIDYRRYEDEARKMLIDIGYHDDLI